MKKLMLSMMILFIGLDQLTKYWAANSLRAIGDIKIWPGVLQFTYLENRGAAFGMLQGRQWLFIIITAAVLIGVVLYWKHIPLNKSGWWMKWALVMIIAGAIGNLIDRVLLGYVRDFIYFILIDFPIFNIADILVVVGVMVLIPILLFGDIETEHKGN